MLSSFIFVSLNLGPRYSSIISDCTARLSSPCYKLQSPLKMCFNQLLETFFAVYGRYLAFFWFFMHQAKLFTGIKKSIHKLILLNTLEYRLQDASSTLRLADWPWGEATGHKPSKAHCEWWQQHLGSSSSLLGWSQHSHKAGICWEWHMLQEGARHWGFQEAEKHNVFCWRARLVPSVHFVTQTQLWVILWL